jgi:hypothetical protein
MSSDEKCPPPPPVNVKVSSSIPESLDHTQISQPMTKQLLTEGFRRSIREPSRFGRCFSVLAFLLPHLDFNGIFMDIMTLEDKVLELPEYEKWIKAQRLNTMAKYKDLNISWHISDDLNEYKEEIKQMANKLNAQLFKIISANMDRLSPLFEEDSLADIE